MMKAERIAVDINEASEFLNGNASPVPLIASLVRRLERKSHEAPGLLDPIERIHKALEQIRVNGEILHWTIQLLPKDESGVSENQLYRKYHS